MPTTARPMQQLDITVHIIAAAHTHEVSRQ